MDVVGVPQSFAEEAEESQRATMLLITPHHLKSGSENVRVFI